VLSRGGDDLAPSRELRPLEAPGVRLCGAIERGHYEDRSARGKLEAQRERAEEILFEVEPSLGFARVLVVHPPVAVGKHFARVVMKVERGQVCVGPNRDRSVLLLHASVQGVVSVRERMMISKGDERAHLEEAARPRKKRVADDHGIFAGDQKYRLLEAALAHPVGEDRERIEAERAEKLVAARVHDARVEVAGELDRRAFGLDHFFHSREKHVAANRRR
jgi:hypothetical protein